MTRGVPREFEAIHYEPDTGESFYNPKELKLFETNGREQEMLAAARGHVEVILAVEGVRVAREEREGCRLSEVWGCFQIHLCHSWQSNISGRWEPK